MNPDVELLVGVAGTGKTARLLEAYRAALQESIARKTPGTTLWLSPTQRSRRGVLQALPDASLPVCFAPNVFTFDAFAERILQSGGREVSLLSGVAQRTLLRGIIEHLHQRGDLPYFSSIAHTTGFLDLVLSFISELKRDETWPEHFSEACRERGEAEKDHELALIYGEYQSHLQRHGLYDAEGRFWSARTALAHGARGPFEQLSLVVVDGFTDFTHTQYEILESLARTADRMRISLPLESPLTRSDLFAKSAAALDRLQRMAETGVSVRVIAHPLNEDTERIAERGPTGRPSEERDRLSSAVGSASLRPRPRHALPHLAENLFANPRDVQPLPDAEGVEILPVTGQLGEIEELAARVKGLLLSGVPADEIVVAFRAVDESSELVEEVFTAAGIPFRCEAGTPLFRAANLKALLAVLQLEREDWPFERLMAVLDSNYFRPQWAVWHNGRAPREVASQLRRLKLHSGRATILRALERECRKPAVVNASESADAEQHQSVADALALLQALSAATEPLRKPAMFAEWTRSVLMLGRELGIAPPPRESLSSPIHDPFLDRDLRIWDRFERLLQEADRAETLFDLASRQLDLSEFSRRLQELIQADALPPFEEETGRVLVLDAANVRSLDVPYLFLAGMTETSFPRHRGDDCLYNESERRRLNEHGLTLGHRSSRNQDEMLMFYSVVTRARNRLVLSYPAVSAKGQPLFPSPYVTAVKSLFTPDALNVTSAVELDPVPRDDRILSASDLRVVATVQARENHPGLFRALLEEPETAPTAQTILAGVDMAVHRFHTTGFTNYEGLLQHPEHRSRLQERFPRDYEFSATQLENYAGCPFRFFVRSLLGIEPLEPPDAVTDLRDRGQLVHKVLADLHRTTDSDRKPSDVTPDELAERFRDLVADRLGRRVRDSELQSALMEIERELLDGWASAYAEQWNEYASLLAELWDSPPTPEAIEIPFGHPQESPEDEPTHQFDPLTFGTGNRETRVCGRIDRVDVGSQGSSPVFNVIDYKTGSLPKFRTEDVQTGRAIQLALYTLAVQRLELAGAEAVPYQMGYWSLRDTGFVSGLKGSRKKTLKPVESAVLEVLEKTLDELIPRLAAGIRGGTFAVYSQDPHCTGSCPYRTVCRVNQVRPLEEPLQKRLEL